MWFTRTPRWLAAAVAVAAAGACDDSGGLVGEGGRCSFDADCTGVLLCLEGRCRDAGWLGGDVDACATDRDCPMGERCRKGVCLPEEIEPEPSAEREAPGPDADAEGAEDGPAHDTDEVTSEPEARAEPHDLLAESDPDRPADGPGCEIPGGVNCTMLCGDVNGNSQIEICDVWLIGEAIAGRVTLEICQVVVADVDISGKVDAADAAQLEAYLRGERADPGCD